MIRNPSRGNHEPIANDRLRHMHIGYARVSKTSVMKQRSIAVTHQATEPEVERES